MRPSKWRRPSRKSDREPLAPDASVAFKALVEHVLSALGRQDVHPTAPLRTVRPAPPHVGVGVVVSDLAVRLFHAHAIRSARMNHTNESRTFASPHDLAAFCVDIMHRVIDTNPIDFHAIRHITQPTDDHVAHGVHRDRIVLVLGQCAVAIAQEMPLADHLPVLHCDDAILVVHKPPNLPTVVGKDPSRPSVQRLIRVYYPDARIVHRLDQETSGLLVVALTKTAAQHLNAQFRDRTIKKTYIARVLGRVHDDTGDIQLCMGPSATQKLIQVVRDDGVASQTTWRVLARSPSIDSTLVELQPITGRTHQLRVHMLHLGHPILGDSLYAVDRVQSLAPRLLLHAHELTFQHPKTNDRITITCPTPRGLVWEKKDDTLDATSNTLQSIPYSSLLVVAATAVALVLHALVLRVFRLFDHA